MSDIPIVGQPFTIVTAYSTAVIQCQCEAKAVLVLAGLNRPAVCPACRKVFAIASSGTVEIGQIVMPTAADLVTQ